MDSCQRFKELMSDYIEGGLLPQQKSQMEYHFRECLKCTKLTQRLRNLIHELKGLPKVTVSPDFETILRARISIESGLARRRREGFFASLQFRIPAYAISAVLIVLGLLNVFSKLNQPARVTIPEAYVNQQWYGGVQQTDKSSEDLFIYFIERRSVYTVTSQSPFRVSSSDNPMEMSTVMDSTQNALRTINMIERRENPQSPIY